MPEELKIVEVDFQGRGRKQAQLFANDHRRPVGFLSMSLCLEVSGVCFEPVTRRIFRQRFPASRSEWREGLRRHLDVGPLRVLVEWTYRKMRAEKQGQRIRVNGNEPE